MFETLVCAAAVALGGMTNVCVPGTLPAAATKDTGNGPAIVHIVSRNQTLTVRSGKAELLYSLTGTDGKTIVADATAEKFAQLHPELYRQVRQFIAVKSDESEIIAYDGIDTR
jgi:hypothetical protein